MQEKFSTTPTENISFTNALRFLFWSTVAGLTLYFIAGHLIKYSTRGIPDFFGDTFWNKRFWFYIHIAGGALAIIIGPLQFWKRVRTRYVHFHRTAGKLYIIGSILAVVGLIRILPDSLCMACRPSQFVVTPLWLLTTIAAWWTIKRRNIKAHRQFMARSYLFAFYFVAVRVLDRVGETLLPSVKKDSGWYANTDWLVWVLPLIILEIYQTWWPTLNLKTINKKTAGEVKNISSVT
jgi:uncharacterized membrane protein YozB (DUF420 family)